MPDTSKPLGSAPAPFRPAQLNPNVVPQAGLINPRPRGERGVQMPVGQPATQGEVDDLIKKFLRFKINSINTWTVP
jgi:hypothetical protein